MDIAQRKDMIVFIGVIILAFFIGYNVIYKINKDKIESIKSQVEEEKKKNDVLGIIDLLDKKLQAHQRRAFSTTEITQFVEKISELAKKAGIKIEAVNPKQPINRDEYIELSLEIPLRCDYDKFGELLSLIESNQELIWVQRFKIDKPTVYNPRQSRLPKIDFTVSGLYLEK